MSPTSYQTAPPRDTGGGAIIVAPLTCVKDPVNSSSLLPIPVPYARGFWHGSGWGRARMKRLLVLIGVLAAGRAGGAALPGFGVRLVGTAAAFASSVAVDSRGVVYYTTQKGDLFRLGDDGQSLRVAHVNTVAVGNSGLLGMALRDDRTAIVHYTTPMQIADIIASIDLETGVETVIHVFNADIDMPSRGSSPEHHGGNPTVAADGSIFVGIGDYGGFLVAALPDWNGGKIWRIFPDGSVQQFARGFRNPFDVAWDAANQRLIVPDNGDDVDDEINVVHLGDDCGWPYTMGDGPVIEGTTRPVYVFPAIVAPTGFTALSGRNPILRHGYLLGTFVSKAIYCNGDGRVDVADLNALAQELADGGGEAFTSAQNGAFAASWGCDVNGDGLIDKADVAALVAIVKPRMRAVRSGH